MPRPPSIPPISVHSSSSSSSSHLRSSPPSPFLTSDLKSHFPPYSNPLANKKKHVCHVCTKAFTTSGHLSRHARIHTGERNHKCPFPGCDTRCSRQDNLQQQSVSRLVLNHLHLLTLPFCSYRIHLTPGSRRSSASSRTHVLSGVKKHAKAPPVSEAPPDSPPSTPPALELAFVPHVYSSSEPSPSMSNLSILYPPALEYVKQDYQEVVSQPNYFDPRGSPHCGFRDSCIQPAASELGSFSLQHRIYNPSSGGPVMTESHIISDMPNTATYGVYSACPPANHPPPSRLSPTQSIGPSMHADVSLVHPRPRSNFRDRQELPLHTNLKSIQSHLSPIPSSSSPSPVSSLSMSSHSSEHSPSAYQKHSLTTVVVNSLAYPPSEPSQTQVQNDYTMTDFHSSQFIPTETEYNRAVSSSASWQNRLSDVRGMAATPGEGVGFVL